MFRAFPNRHICPTIQTNSTSPKLHASEDQVALLRFDIGIPASSALSVVERLMYSHTFCRGECVAADENMPAFNSDGVGRISGPGYVVPASDQRPVNDVRLNTKGLYFFLNLSGIFVCRLSVNVSVSIGSDFPFKD